MKDSEFLSWIWQRMVNVHGEQSNVDYMLRLNGIILSMKDNDTETDISFEQPKPRTKTEFVKVEYSHAWEIIKLYEDGVELFKDDSDELQIDRINSIALRAQAGYPIYRKVETEIDERQEFVDAYMNKAKSVPACSDADFAGILYDSGKFKLVEK